MKQSISFFLFAMLSCGSFWAPCRADDLDDGIAIDDSLIEYDQIGDSIEPNYSYIALRAQSNVAARSDAGTDDLVTGEGSVLNSVILEAGATVQGDIYIIDQSRGDKTIITQ
ncbi:MAG TPA: hypothetical protein ENK96_07760 [Desulfobulbaceae bacterium]|nr:hypothetical protein [Desulfobulbaceae bacterium]